MAQPLPQWDSEADVVIAGAGGAGLQAALQATQAGASVIVFEKQMRIWDSSTAIAVGRASFPCTDLQQKNGVEDSKELMARDILETGRHKNDPMLVQAYVDHALETYRQLCALGIVWSPTVTAMAGMSVPRGHLTDMIDLVRTLKRAAETRGVPVVFQTPVTGLVTDDGGNVLGAAVRERSGKTTHIRARKGVVLASGGFARDPERLRAIEPRFAQVVATSGVGNTGDGLRMAEALGADTRDIEYVQPSFELHATGGTSDDIMILYYQGGIIVNARGERFVNESISYKDIARACLDQPGMMGFQVFDQAVYEKAVAAQAAAGQSSPMTLDGNKIRLLVKGCTLEELAENMAVPPGALRRTVERYNRFVDEGRDADFGREVLAGNFGKPVRVDRAPYYAYATIGHLLATYGGIAVDAQMRVLKKGRPIPGLYAAGEVMGGFHGASYHSGTGIGKALIFGRIAGNSAATRT
jgi:fumarate reductase flavoprotein subunit